MKFWLFTLIVAATLCLSGCSGSSPAASSTSQPPPAATYSIGGSVSGLTGTGLTLQDNGGNNLSLGAGATSFTFTTSVASGDAYSVTVLTQPSTPSQNCAVTNASGTATANVTNVQVTCTTTAIPSYTIGGSVSGLTGSGLVLQDNGGDNLTIAVNGSFTFATSVASGGPYLVTVLTQPSSPTQTCTVVNGSGNANANVTNVQIGCAAPVPNLWTWMGGSDVVDQAGVYGTLGVPASGNVPGARDSGVTWVDAAGSLWLFGGFGFDSTGTGDLTVINDLWKYSGGEWTWMSGSDVGDQSGIYGTKGVAAPGNVPGSRKGSNHWIDSSANFWLFGGLDPSYGVEYNDLWEFSGGEWTWVSGSNFPDQPGTYGTQGVAASGNVPGGRVSAVSWIDTAGNFWLFGGDATDSVDNFGIINDLWKYSAGQWTWMGGANTILQSGTYGTQGVASATNFPGARRLAVSWTAAAGNFWLFGGDGYDSKGTHGELNDLWKYSAGQWTWVNGSNLANQSPTYGTLGVAAASNVPGARDSALSLLDPAGNFWLFGGEGYDSNGTYGELNDLWKFSAGQWTWVSGASIANQPTVYGVEGTSALGDAPGARIGAMGWSDAAGNLWLFGGAGYGGAGTGELNDVWKYTP